MTGYKELDDKITGLKERELIIIASRPGMGKSTFAINIINNVAEKSENRIIYFNLETSKESLKDRVNNKVEIIDNPKISVEEIKEKSLSMTEKVSLVVIDYLQLINNTVEDIVTTLKVLALELNIPIILLSQLPRNLEEREDKRPILADLSMNDSILQEIDKVLFLYRDNYYNQDSKENTLEIIVAKNKNGEQSIIKI